MAIVLAAKGYPGDPRRGDPIEGLDAAATTGALVFHAGTTARRAPRAATARTAGASWPSSGLGPDVAAARAVAERAADAITWDGMQRRHDIALELPVPEAAR